MSTIEEQIALEQRMVAYGISRYNAGVSKAKEKERFSNASSAQKLLQEFIAPIAEEIKDYVESSTNAGVNKKYKELFKVVDYDTAAYLGLKAILDYFTVKNSLVSLGQKIGTMIEDEAKFKRFKEQHPEYYNTIINDFKKKGTTNYRHMHRVLTNKANEHNVAWNSWSNDERIKLGICVVDLIMKSTNLITKGVNRESRRKHRACPYTIVPTTECLEWLKKFDAYAQLLTPDRLPCVIKPDDWISEVSGGYYTPQLRIKCPLVKVRNKEQSKFLTSNIQPVLNAVNAMQNVPWQINTEVLDVLSEVWNKSLPIGLPQSEPYEIPSSPIPRGVKKQDMNASQKESFDQWKSEARVVHTMNKERVSKCFQVIRVIKIAKEYKNYAEFYYVYYCDFRGRVYATVAGLSPQGADYAKALLKFAKGQPITERGIKWLRIHGANCYGKDKLSYTDREQWVVNNERLILSVAENPISNKDLWSGADKPWQFLAFCLEYQKIKRGGCGTLTYLPIALDGSCNGLQNFSAMLRDAVGGQATNLIPSDYPSDIYSAVARVCTEKLNLQVGELADIWKAFCSKQDNGIIPRSLAKRPVMTLPYGSTRQSCNEYIYKSMVEDYSLDFDKRLRFKLSVWLTPFMWDSIGEVVIAARRAMDWIQKASATVSKENLPLYWTTPLGFTVYREKFRCKSKQIFTELAGRIRLRISEDTDKIDVMKQRQGSSPNFIHSMDATHLMMTVLRASECYNITNLACIHDDFGTDAEHTEDLHKAIREAFVELYSKYNPLQDFKDTQEEAIGYELPELPSKGTLDINQVLESKYFFG